MTDDNLRHRANHLRLASEWRNRPPLLDLDPEVKAQIIDLERRARVAAWNVTEGPWPDYWLEMLEETVLDLSRLLDDPYPVLFVRMVSTRDWTREQIDADIERRGL